MEEKGLVLVVFDEMVGPEPFFTKDALKINDKVIITNESGVFLGRVVGHCNKSHKEKPTPIDRIATKDDIDKFERNAKKAKSALKTAKEMVKKYTFEMKLISALYSLDSSKIIFTFSSENRVDFREYVKELATTFKTRIELKQIGSRDETKCLGGLGMCGKICCCNEFLPEFARVSIKMAKNQNLSLSPQKINGLCGRLMCCLSYENESYEKVMRRMPKLNSEVIVPDGKGVAIYNDILNEKVSVKVLDKDGSYEIKDYELKDIKVKIYAIKD